MSHLSVCELLLEAHTQTLEASTSFLNVIDTNGDVAKSSWLTISIMIAFEIRIGLRAVVVCQLEYS